MEEKIKLIDYNAEWVNEFEIEKKEWKLILDTNLISIHHIGSTAIPNMKSKPIIDILIEVNSHKILSLSDNYLLESGYIPKGEYGIEGRRFYQKIKNGIRKVHVHCFQYGSPQLGIHLKFRDKLRINLILAKEYENLKIKLASEYENDREEYTIGKNEFIQNVLAL